MKRRFLLSAMVIALVAALIGGATMAWFTSEKTTTAKFTAGTVIVGLTSDMTLEDDVYIGAKNWNPGDSTEVTFTMPNEGTKKIWVRVSFSGAWEGELSGNNVTFAVDDNWKLHTDGYYYYKNILDGSFETTPTSAVMTLTVKFDGPGTNNTYQGKTYTLNYKVEAIQASNKAAEEVWGVNPATLFE